MDLRHGFSQLWQLIKYLQDEGVDNREDARSWLQDNEPIIESILEYQRQDKMPAASSLIQLDYHPVDPLILLNYTQIAHNTLYQFPDGWTLPLRLCRGTVFTRRGRLVGFGFPKFFNDGEHPETHQIDAETMCQASIKHDGHLGIMYEFKGKRFVTTRGSFTSKTSVLAQEMLERYERKFMLWSDVSPNTTYLVEIIHPETQVHVEYFGEKTFRLLARTNRKSLTLETKGLSSVTNATLFLPPKTEYLTIGELRRRVLDLSIKNVEGYVARLPDGRLIKFKYRAYLSKMIGEKITVRYIMQRMINRDLDERMRELDPEVQQYAYELRQQITAVLATSKGKDRIAALAELDRDDAGTAGYQKVSRELSLATP